jgi:putative endopeptidase
MLKERILMFATCTIMVGGVMLTSCSQQEATQAEAPVVAIDTNNFDKSVKPGDNFFDYSNGTWLKNNPIPPEKTRYGSFDILDEDNKSKLRQLIEDAATKGGAAGSAEQQVGDFYKSGMDTAAINKLGFEPIKPNLTKVADIKDKAEWWDVVYYLHSETVCPLFGIYAGQDDKNSAMVIANLAQSGLGLGNRDYYTEDDERSKNIRAEYVKHIAKMFTLIGVPETDAEQSSKRVMEFETKLAKNSMTNVEQRDPFKVYNKVSFDEAKKKVTGVDLDKYFAALGIATPAEINITSLPFFSGLGKAVESTDIAALKDYLTWCIVNDADSYLSQPFVDASFEFYGKVFSGQQQLDSLWKRRLNLVSGQLDQVLGKLYVTKYFPPEAKTRMLDLIGNLRKSLSARIEKLDWMSPETKAKAQEKLEAIRVKVGYPDKWEDYSKIAIKADDFFGNVVNCSKFHFQENLSEIGKPYDKEKWHMSPQTVNAYYSPNSNEIVFPAGILQPPFFYKDGDDAVNYGGIGVVIGHEITHGFDDQGCNYDKDGNLNTWWTEEDSKKFKEKATKFGEEYAKYSYPQLAPPNTINPQLTMGENIADLGGVNISYDALMMALQAKPQDNIDGLTPDQRFFLSYSQVWRQNIRDEALANRLKNDPHSPGDARVNVIVPNFDVWYKAFDVKEGDKMYIAPEQRAVIW